MDPVLAFFVGVLVGQVLQIAVGPLARAVAA